MAPTPKKPAAAKAAAKPARAKPAAKPAATAAAAKKVDDTPVVRVRGPSLRIKGLVDHVTEATGVKKKDVKAVVEATLAALGDALGRSEELNLPGFGRSRVARTVEKDGASHLTLKIRRGPHKKRENNDNDALADDGEDS